MNTIRSFLSLFTLLIALVPAVQAQKPSAGQLDPQPPPDSHTEPDAGAAPPEARSSPETEEEGLRLNFRGVPLEMVLDYLSEAAGFIIVLETDIEGTVDVWSNQPLNRDEAVDLLNTILHAKGYAAVRNGRTLQIVQREDAKQRNIPVQSGADPSDIPPTDQMVTQIIPIRYANASQMVNNLQSLLPSYASLTANESGNALVLTDTQSNIRRIVEIVQALDTSISSISTVVVFPLRYADATELATAVKELFQTSTQQNNNNDPRARFFSRFGRGRGDDDRDQPTTGDSQALQAASRVVAVAEERTNSLVVSAPDELISVVRQLVEQLDVNVSDITELRVFQLENADPLEVASIFAELFPDETGGQEENRGRGFRFGDRGGRSQPANTTSERAKKQGRVVAVADPRTSSLIVSAASELMPEIGRMIEQLDSSSAKNQKVFVYSLENADVTQVERVLREMFERTQSGANRSSTQDESALDTRRQRNQNNSNTGIGGGFGNTGSRTGQTPR